MISKNILYIVFLNEPELLFYWELKDFTYFYLIQIVLFSINHYLHTNVLKNFYVSLIIHLNITNLFTHS